MIDHAHLLPLIAQYGMWILTPLAVIEGPIVTVIAAYLASLSLLNLWLVVPCVILADIVGDGILYWVGRSALGRLSPTWRQRLGLSQQRLFALTRGYHRNGAKILIAAKLTHAAGFAALTAAGAAHMPFDRFILINALTSIPKSLFFIAIGYLFGNAYQAVDGWMSLEALLLAPVLLAILAFVYFRRRGGEP